MRYLAKFILLIFLFATTACNKKRTIHIKAINAVTGEAYAGLQFSITASKTALNGEKKVFEHNGVLDANGEAFVSVKVKQGRTYNIGCKEPPNTCYTKNINFTFAEQDNTNGVFQFEYAECGFLQLKVKNTSCFDANDEITFNTQPINLIGYNKINPLTKLGCYDNEFVDSKVPFGPWITTWQVTKNGVTSNHDSTFYINENQHYYFLLEY